MSIYFPSSAKALLTIEEVTITTLPAELHLKIFDYLGDDPGAAACLGITCKTVYPLYRARHKTVDLCSLTGCARCIAGRHSFRGPTCRVLHFLLMDWMGPGYIYCRQSNIFITRERLEHLEWKEESEKRRVERQKRERIERIRRLFREASQ